MKRKTNSTRRDGGGGLWWVVGGLAVVGAGVGVAVAMGGGGTASSYTDADRGYRMTCAGITVLDEGIESVALAFAVTKSQLPEALQGHRVPSRVTE